MGSASARVDHYGRKTSKLNASEHVHAHVRFNSFPSSLLLIILFPLSDPRSSTSPQDDTTIRVPFKGKLNFFFSQDLV